MLNQTFSWDERTWDVDDVLIVAQHKPVEYLDVANLFQAVFLSGHEDLTDEPVGSPDFLWRCPRASLHWPILVVRGDDGSLTVVDGCHRTWKAWSSQALTIKAHVLSWAELYAIPTTT